MGTLRIPRSLENESHQQKSKRGLARTKDCRTGNSPGHWLGLLLSSAARPHWSRSSTSTADYGTRSRRCLGLQIAGCGSRVGSSNLQTTPSQANGHVLVPQSVLTADVVDWGFVDSERPGGGWGGVMLFELVSRGRSKDWEVGRLVSFQLRTNRAANTVPDRPGPLPSRLGRAMRHQDISGHPAPAEPNISAGNATLQTGGHFSWSEP